MITSTLPPSNLKLRLGINKLLSGKFQINYEILEGKEKGSSGCIFVRSESTLKETVGIIRRRVRVVDSKQHVQETVEAVPNVF